MNLGIQWNKIKSTGSLGSQLVQLLLVSATIGIIILFSFGPFYSISSLERLENSLLDSRFRSRGIIKNVSPKVVLVSISQETFKSMKEPYNSWPLPRSVYAKMIDNLTSAGVKAIGIDLVMSSPDRFDPVNDSLLIAAIRKSGKVVVAGKLDESQRGDHFSFTKDENLNFQNIFFTVDSSIGIVNIKKDDDGIIRKYEPVWTLPFNPPMDIPSFAFATLNKYYGFSYNKVPSYDNKIFSYAGLSFPKYDESSFLINFYGPSGYFPNINLSNIIDDKTFITRDEEEYGAEINMWEDVDKSFLKDKIVLVGSFDPLEKDQFNISFSDASGANSIYGIEIYANIIQSFLDKNFISREPSWMQLLIIVLFSLLSFYSRSVIKKVTKSPVYFEILIFAFTLSLVYMTYQLSFVLFTKFNFSSHITSPIMAVLFNYIAGTAYHYISEKKQSGLIKKMFGQYVNSNLLEELMSHPDRLRLGGVRMELTVFFSDIAGFTNLSEKKNSEELVNLLNEYLTAMTEIIFDYKGTLDKYQGDAIMAFWGAPVKVENHALLCCKAVLAMQKKVAVLQKKWVNEGQDVISVRMGINTGEMVVGNMGGNERFDYTVIGDNVNLASRLEGVNKEYGTDIIISEATYDIVKDFIIVRELDYIKVKGKNKPIKIFELVGMREDNISNEKFEIIDYFECGLQKYREGNFEDAREFFDRVLFIDPKDAPANIFIKRCERYIILPPSHEWSGIHIMTSK